MVFQKAIKVADLPEESVAKAVVSNREIALIHHAGNFVAFDGICTHEGGPLGEGTIEGDELVCPWHQGRYNIPSGEANPDTNWITDIRTFPTKVEDGYVWIDV